MPYFMLSIMGQQNGMAQALFLQGFGFRPETYPLWDKSPFGLTSERLTGS
jgi:hypothetical protein